VVQAFGHLAILKTAKWTLITVIKKDTDRLNKLKDKKVTIFKKSLIL